MQGPVDVGLDQALEFLDGRFGPSVEAVEFVGEGAWSRCFGFRFGDDALVVRFGHQSDDFEKDRRAAAFAQSALPVPQVTDIGTALGGYFAISERVYGKPLEELSPDEWRNTLPSMFEALDTMRSVDTSDLPGCGLWDRRGIASYPTWREFLLSTGIDSPALRTHGWRKRLNAMGIGDGVFGPGLALMAELAEAAPPERFVVHGDLLNRNVLVHDGRIRGVFDWGCSLYGDFVYELALLAFWSGWHPGLASVDVVTEVCRHWSAGGVAIPDFEARLRCCMIHVGLDHHAWCATIGDEKSLIRINQQTRDLIDQ